MQHHLEKTMPQPECAGLAGRIFGHAFSFRYDALPPEDTPSGTFNFTSEAVEMAQMLTKQVYVCDVCTRCGAMSKREP